MLLVITGCLGVEIPASPSPPSNMPASLADSSYFFHGRGYGTDVYAGPFDAILNKGFAVAQWEDRNRAIFDHNYGWRAVSQSLTHPGEAVARAGGWKKVLLVHGLPFYRGGYREPQWVTNYFGHVVEGGLVYRRLYEWNRANGLPLPKVNAALVTYASAIINEAYETPPPADGSLQLGNAGIVMDLLVFDPLGILLFSFDGVARSVSRMGATLWPRQGSFILNSRTVHNNGESVVLKLPLPFTRHRLFIRGGLGIEGGLTYRRRDGLDLSIAAGMQSHTRRIDPETQLEQAEFAWSASTWLDRDGTLLAGLTFDTRTDRRISLDIYPGLLRAAGVGFGAWVLLDAEGRPYIGLTGRTLGLGAGLKF